MSGFVKLPNKIFELKLSPYEFCVLCFLCKCRNSVTGKCFPSYNKIACECNISRSSVICAVKSLKEKSIIKVKNNFENHFQRCNDYEIGL